MKNKIELVKDDLALVKDFKKGSKEAFSELVLRHESKVFSLALRYTRNQEDAEDAFITLYNKIDLFEGKSAFSSWLYRIVVNCALMKLRKNRQEKATHYEDLSLTAKMHYNEVVSEDMLRSDSRLIQHETRTALEIAINKLPDEYKSVFIMKDVDGLTNEEVAKILSLSVAAVKSRLHRARIMLQKKLNRFYQDYKGVECDRDLTKGNFKLTA